MIKSLIDLTPNELIILSRDSDLGPMEKADIRYELRIRGYEGNDDEKKWETNKFEEY